MTDLHNSTGGGEESFASLFEESLKGGDIKEGGIVRGRVIHVAKDYVVVDIGYKSEGQVPIEEFQTGDGAPKEGDEIEVYLESRENENGLCVLSKEKADRLKVWDEISEACERDELIDGTVAQRVKGGLSVTIRGGVKAFLPGSQVDLRPVRNLDAFIGKNYKFKVIKFNKKRGNIVLSRRVLLEKERAELKEQTLEKLKEGQIVEGIVKNLTEYGAFIDLGGIDGLLHITDMSWGRVNHPSEMFQVGDHVRVKVLKFNSDTERVSLGLKQITEDPWVSASERYTPGTVVKGKVVSLKDYGAFIELEQGIDGLVHISDMSWTQRVKHPSELFTKGDDVEAVVLNIDTTEGDKPKISLGIKQLVGDPWDRIPFEFPVGKVVSAKVQKVLDFGAFVEIEKGIEGLIHVSEISDQRVEDPREVLKPGQEVKVEVISIDQAERKIGLSMKAAARSAELAEAQGYSAGTPGATLGDVFRDKLKGLSKTEHE
jgi:small subunit ribosomal protein S1